MKSNQIFSKFYSEFILLINQLRNCIEIIKMKNEKFEKKNHYEIDFDHDQ